MESTKLKRPKHKGSPKLFDNPILEKLTHTHISLPLIIFSVIAAALIYYGIIEKGFTAPSMILLFFAGLLFFTLIEYIMHRYLYHIPATSERKKKISYTVSDRAGNNVSVSMSYRPYYVFICPIIKSINLSIYRFERIILLFPCCVRARSASI